MNNRRALCAVLSAVLFGMLLAGCGKLDGSKTAATVNGEAIPVGAVSFDAHYQAAMFMAYYGSYMSDGYFDNLIEQPAETEETAEAEEGAETEEAAEAEEGAETGEAAEAGEGAETEEAAEAEEPEEKSTAVTYGDETVDYALESLVQDLAISQHAEEYGVSLTEEEEAAIDKAAQAYIDANGKDVLAEVGARKEDIAFILRLRTIRSKMMDPIAEDVDTNVSDEEAAQSKITYVSVRAATEDQTDDDGNTVSVADANAAIEENLSSIVEAVRAADDPNSVDMNALAEEFGDSYNVFTTGIDLDEGGVYDDTMIANAKALSDGEITDVFLNSEGTTYFIVRLNALFDREETDENKKNIITSRKTDLFDETIKGWADEADVVKFDKEIRKIKITDKLQLTFKAPEEEAAADEG